MDYLVDSAPPRCDTHTHHYARAGGEVMKASLFYRRHPLSAADPDRLQRRRRAQLQPRSRRRRLLAVAAADADATAVRDGADLLLQVAGVNRDLHVEHADQLHALIK